MALLPLVEAAGVEPAAQEEIERPARPPSGRFHVDAAEAALTIKKGEQHETHCCAGCSLAGAPALKSSIKERGGWREHPAQQ